MKTNSAVSFGEKLKSFRKELGLTQAELAALLEVPARTLWDWEKGRTVPLLVTQEGALRRINLTRRP